MDTASPSNVTRRRQQVTSRAAVCEEADTRALFAALDKDSNGFIDKHELRSTMSEVGLQLSDDDVHTMMKAAGVVIKDRIFSMKVSTHCAETFAPRCLITFRQSRRRRKM